MDNQSLANDPLWPRASTLLKPADGSSCDVAIVGIPAHLTSISPTNAHTTPAAIRAALARFSTWSASHGLDLSALNVQDFGDIQDPDGPEGEALTKTKVAELGRLADLVIGLGGDNSVTYAMAMGCFGENLGTAGLITFDAHHDLRDGISNGSPVRRLVEAGLSGQRIVQIGIADFSNSPEYAMRAMDLGITVIPRSALRTRSLTEVMQQALEIAGAAGGPIHVDIDVDVCDRSVVPACPAAAPGGISADELRQLAYLASKHEQVKSIDITEIDATADTPDQRTVRLAALLILEALAGRF
ncbi:MAG: arginase family protein [Micrococcales bacterium]